MSSSSVFLDGPAPPPHGLREPCKLVDAKAKLGKTLQNDFGAKVLACHSPSV